MMSIFILYRRNNRIRNEGKNVKLREMMKMIGVGGEFEVFKMEEDFKEWERSF